MSSVGAESVAIEEAIDSLLRDAGAVVAIVADRIFPDLAPESTQYPFIVFQQQASTDVVGVGANARIMVNADWIVRGVTKASAYSGLKTLARAIDDALEGATWQAPDGQVFAIQRRTEYRMNEQDGGDVIRHLGGLFRVQAQTTA